MQNLQDGVSAEALLKCTKPICIWAEFEKSDWEDL